MAGKLIMLPFRVWLGSARLLTRAAGEAAARAVALAGHTLGAASSDGSPNGGSPEWQQAPPDQSPGWREEPIEEPASPVDVEHPHDEADRPGQPRPAPPPRPATEPARPVSAVEPLNAEPPAPIIEEPEPPAPIIEEPVHVSEEPELVREEAEPGAEDGAGAQLTVMEPWNGYARMNAREVIDRAREAGPAELAAVRLYEARHRSRQTVLAAVDRQLKLSSGSNPA
jgi:hypothetical protein